MPTSTTSTAAAMSISLMSKSMTAHKFTMSAAMALIVLSACTGTHQHNAVGIESVKCQAGIFESGHGLAGAYIGTLGDEAIVAGGSDFLTLRPWEGGSKTCFDAVYCLSKDGVLTEMDGVRLPQGLCNGASVVVGNALYCIGGISNAGAWDRIVRIRRDGQAWKVEDCGTLPEGFRANAAAACDGSIYVAGIMDGSNALYMADPASMAWTELTGCPDKLLTEGSMMVSQDGTLCLIGGRTIAPDGTFICSCVWRYDISKGRWDRGTDILVDGKVTGLMYGAALPWGKSQVVVCGGDDGVEMMKRLDLSALIAATNDPEHRRHLEKELAEDFIYHPGFLDRVFAYDVKADSWEELGTTGFSLPAVTTAAVLDGNILLLSGEEHPGVRSSSLVTIRLK